MGRQLKAAVVGCGPWGQAHMRAYQASPGTELVAVCGRSADSTYRIAEKYGVRGYLSLEELIAKEEIQVATVATGDRDHFLPTSILLGSGVPTLVEKPLTYDLKEARELVRIAEATGVPCGVNFNMRYLMPFQLFRQSIDRKELGRHISWLWRFSHRWFPPAVGPEPAVTITHHIHGLDLLLAMAGPVTRVQAASVPGQDGTSHTTIAALLDFESGALGVVTGGVDGAVTDDIMTLECQGTLGRAIARDATREYSVSILGEGHDRVWRPFFADVEEGNFQKSLDWHLEEFIDAINSGRPPPIPIDEGYEALRLGWAIVEAANTRTPVDMSPGVPTRDARYRAPLAFRRSHAAAGESGYSDRKQLGVAPYTRSR